MLVPSTAQALLGRRRELALIDELLAGARAGDGATVMLSGEPGSGKTTLLERAGELADGFQVIGCRGVEWEAELPFSSLHDLLRPLLGDLDALPTPQRHAVEGALGLGDQDDVQRLNVYAGTLSLLVEATRHRPVLVLVDDLQWIDSATARALSFISRRVIGEEIGLMIAGRPEAHLDGLPTAPVTLTPLDEAAIAELANRQLATPLPASAVRGLAAATGGNPLAVVESVRQFGEDLRNRGTMLDHPLPVSELIERAFADRLSSLSPAGREAMELIAASLNGGATELLGAAEVLPVSAGAFAELEEAGVAMQRGGLFEISHPVLRSLVHQQASPQQLRRCYAALASAAVADPAHRAWYAASAADAPDESIATALDVAAARFMTKGGYRAAAQALKRSAELTPGLDERADRLLRAGRVAHLGGRSAWGLELLEEARLTAVEPRTAMKVELEHGTVQMHTVEGYPSAAAQLALADKAWEVDHDVSVVALAAAASEAIVSGKGDLLREAIVRMDARKGQADSMVPDSLQALNASLAAALLLTGAPGRDAEATEILRRTARFRLSSGEQLPVEADNDVFVADALIWIEDYDLCEQLVDDAVPRSQATGDVFTLMGLVAIDAGRRFRIGDWAGAVTAYSEALRLAEITEIRWMHGLYRAMLANLQAARGDDTIVSIVDEIEEVATTFGFGVIVQYTGSALGLLHLGAGRNVEAAAALDRVDAWTRRAGQVDAGLSSWPTDHVEAHLLAGDLVRARALLEDVRAANLEAGARPWKAAAIARLDGLLAGEDDYEPHFRRALGLYEHTRTPFDRARTQLAFGQRLRRSRRRVEAREQLMAALTEFDRLGAAPWADHARREMGASVASLKRGASFDADALTPQEQQVARLVASGGSNKEVAGTMFLSPKTIEAHLSRIYRKLGVSTRTQLAAQLRD